MPRLVSSGQHSAASGRCEEFRLAANNSADSSRPFGAIDMELLRQCPCPVWLVERRASRRVPRRILAAVHANPDEPTEQALNKTSSAQRVSGRGHCGGPACRAAAIHAADSRDHAPQCSGRPGGRRPFRRRRLWGPNSGVVLLAFGALTVLEAPRLQTNLPTPWIGLWERINISAFLLWVAVLATALLRAPRVSAVADRRNGPGTRT